MAAPKADASATPAAAAAGGTTPPVAAAPAAAKGGLMAWMPVFLSLVVAPAATWGTAQFVLVPALQKKLSAPVVETPVEEKAPEVAAKNEKGEKGKEGKEGGGKDSPNYEFSNVVVNLAGTMGTRYLKTTFLVTAAEGKGNANIKSVFEANKPMLTDVTLNVLSALTLSDLEEPGAKNVIREKLIAAYNQALKKKIADQVYFSDFVVQ